MPDLDRADSVTVDPHKWFFQAYDIGGLLVRDGAHLGAGLRRRAPEYYRGGETPGRPRPAATRRRRPRRPASQLNFYKLSFEGTRRWRALKLWMSWKHLGTDGFGAAHRGERRPGGAPRARAAPSPTTSRPSRTSPSCRVVCFRHLPGGRAAASALAPAELDAHQDALQRALEVSGDGWLTTTRLRGATWLRAGIVNYLATEDDIDRLLDTLRRLAAGED